MSGIRAKESKAPRLGWAGYHLLLFDGMFWVLHLAGAQHYICWVPVDTYAYVYRQHEVSPHGMGVCNGPVR